VVDTRGSTSAALRRGDPLSSPNRHSFLSIAPLPFPRQAAAVWAGVDVARLWEALRTVWDGDGGHQGPVLERLFLPKPITPNRQAPAVLPAVRCESSGSDQVARLTCRGRTGARLRWGRGRWVGPVRSGAPLLPERGRLLLSSGTAR
jgi:hypothetical protein